MVAGTLGLWIVTAVGGMYLWSFTTDAGRSESSARASALHPGLLFVHPLIMLSGLAVWTTYLVHGGDLLPWVAFGILLLGAGVGDVMALRTFRGRRARGGVPAAERAARTPGAEPADVAYVEDRMPTAAIVAHGTLALATIAMVLLVALGVGV